MPSLVDAIKLWHAALGRGRRRCSALNLRSGPDHRLRNKGAGWPQLDRTASFADDFGDYSRPQTIKNLKPIACNFTPENIAKGRNSVNCCAWNPAQYSIAVIDSPNR